MALRLIYLIFIRFLGAIALLARSDVSKEASPLRPLPDPVDTDIQVIRRDRLGGLLHEYAQVAYG